MPKQEKIDAVAELKQSIASASALYFVDFTKVPANDFNSLRRRLGDVTAPVRVVKNRLALRALAESDVSADFVGVLKGPTSMVFAGDDPVAPARVIREAMKKIAALKVKGAFVDRNLYLAEAFEFLASLPTKHELRGQVVGVLEAPIAELVFGLEGLIADLVYVLEQVRDRPAAGSPDPVASN
jgi:large subunit ribosomal protein L10